MRPASHSAHTNGLYLINADLTTLATGDTSFNDGATTPIPGLYRQAPLPKTKIRCRHQRTMRMAGFSTNVQLSHPQTNALTKVAQASATSPIPGRYH